MNKLLAIIKREYLERVRSKIFIIATLLGPLIMIGFAVVPSIAFNIKTGGATRIAIVDQTGFLYERVRDAILHSDDKENAEAAPNPTAQKNNGSVFKTQYAVEEYPLKDGPLDEAKKSLSERIRRNTLDAYLVIPPDILRAGKGEYYARNLGDVIGVGEIKDRLSDAVIEQRMSNERLDRNRINELLQKVDITTKSEAGEEKNSGSSFVLAFIVGFFIYMTTIMYGQAILAAVVEEKSTRITEMLFSSVRSFPLMLGKLIGVSLVALTQYLIWALAFGALTLYGATALASSGFTMPHVAASAIFFFILFFLLGYFIYATLYVLVGSMVTTTQEGGQVAMPIIFLLIIGFYLAFPVIRSPDSSFAFWISLIPFFSPITMVVRIMTQTPPLWQIALSFAIGLATVAALIWLAARIYRTGMLMYGKRANLPEVWRWVKQS